MERKVVETVQIDNIIAEITTREAVNGAGDSVTYFDADFLRTYRKKGSSETITTKRFQYRDLEKLIAVIGLAKGKMSELIHNVKSYQS